VETLTEAQHNDIAELLPDFAIGALSDGDLWRVEAHLESCPRCRAEFVQLLDLVSVMAPVAPPSLAARRTLFERAGYPIPEPPLRPAAEAHEPVFRDAPLQPARITHLPARLGRFALAAAAIALFMLGGWNLWLQRELGDQEDLIALISEPGNAYPLTDSEVATDATAIFYVDPERDQALLTAQDLPSLANEGRYQVWLFTEDGSRVSGGSFVPEEGGTIAFAVEPSDPLATYWAVAISAEPEAESESPTSPLLLGGWIQ